MQQSSSPAPISTPVAPEKKPVLVQPEPKRPRGKGIAWLLGIAAICGAAYWLYQKNLADDAIAAKRASTASVRTVAAKAGTVFSTIRLSGTTGPEKFATILGPQLRGSRSFSGGGGAFMGRSRGGGGSSGGGGGSSSGGSSSGGSSGGSSSGSSSATSAVTSSLSASASGIGGNASASPGGSTASMGSAGSGVRNSSNALRAATSRESSSSRSSSGGSRSSSSAASSAAAMGSQGLGSTSSSLFSGGGSSSGGSSGGDFGSILQELIAAGKIVKKGETVAEFDRQYMLQRLDDYKAGVDQQHLNLKRQLADLDVSRKAHEQSILSAKADVEKAKLDLRTVPVRSAIDSERFRLALEEAEARYNQLLKEVPFVREGEETQLRLSDMDLKQSQLELRRAEANADRMIVKAPINGMVVMLTTFRGSDFAQYQSGDPVPSGTPFMRIVDPNSMIINAYVNQVDVERVRVGSKARIRFDAFPDLELPGHVYSVSAMPRSSFSGRGNFLKEIPVVIRLDGMDPRVIPDLSVSVDVITEKEESPALISRAAVHTEQGAAEPFVYVRTGDTWTRRTVQLGLASNTEVSVRRGLRPGEIVAEEVPPLPASGGNDAKQARLLAPQERSEPAANRFSLTRPVLSAFSRHRSS